MSQTVPPCAGGQGWQSFVNIARNRSMCTAVAAHRRDLASSPLAGRVPLWVGEGGASYGGFAHSGSWGDRESRRITIPLGSTTQ